jgi:hypothetical protein
LRNQKHPPPTPHEKPRLELVFVLFLFIALPAAAAAGLIQLITRRLRDGRSAKGDP